MPAFASLLVATIGFLLTFGNAARAAYGGSNYYIERPRLAIDLSYRYESDERAGPFVSSRNDTQYLVQRFDIETGGWIYHPALMTYTLRLSPEWQQTLQEPDTGSSLANDAFMLGYDVNMNFLESKPYSFRVFARKQRTTVSSSLASTTETESDTYGATLMLKYKVLPTTLMLTHGTFEQRGFFVSEETRDEARLNMRHKRASNDTSFNATWGTRERTTTGTTTETETLSGNLQNTYRITPDNRITLNSGLVFRDSESNLFSSSGGSLSETLSWRHSQTFSTQYGFFYSKDKTDTSSIDRTSVNAGLSHSLYENLTTSASVSASDGSSGESDYGGNLGFNYQRRIPWGMIFANVGQDYRVTSRSAEQGYVDVINEPHELTTAGAPTVLDNRNIDPDSIVVRSADLSDVFTEGIDYRLECVPSCLEEFATLVRIIGPLPGSSIVDGERVLVSYRYLSLPPYDSSIYSQNYGIGFDLWSAFRINYRYSQSEEDFISGTPPDILQETSSHYLDAELRWKRSTTRFLYEDNDSATGLAFTRTRIEETLLFQPFKSASLSLSGYFGRTMFKEQDTEEDSYGFRSDLQWRVNRWSRAKIEGFYADIDGTSNKTGNIGALARWEWFYGIWRGDATYRYLNEDDRISNQTRDYHSLFFSVRRTLF